MLSQFLRPSNYYSNSFAYPVILVSIIIFSIGIFVLKQNRRSILNMAFSLITIVTAFWLFTISLVYISYNQKLAIFWYRYFTFFAVSNIMPSLLFFTTVLLGKLKQRKKFLVGNYIVSIIFYGLAIGTDKFIYPYEMRRYFWGYYPIYTLWMLPFLIFFLIQIAITIRDLYVAYKIEKEPLKKLSKRIIFFASLIGFVSSVDFLPKFLHLPWLYPCGYITMFLYISIIAYSIVRYKTFDIETVIHKTIMWLFTFSFIIMPMLFLYKWILPILRESNLLQIGFWLISFIIVTIYLRIIQPKIDHIFQRRTANLEEISNRFSEHVVHLRGLTQLIERIEDIIADTLYPQRIDIFIYNESEKKYKLANSFSDSQKIKELKGDNQFLFWLVRANKITYQEFIDIDPKYNSIREKAKDYFHLTQATVVIPLVLNDNLLGIINLSKKANLKRYNATDFHFLTTLKNQSTIALSNSLLYENMEGQVRQRTKELLEMQRQLIQAEKLATVGTLAGGVAHEINNPLTAILTNVQMLLTIGNGMDSDSKESLQLIEEATRRCRSIVQKLMTYAKKPLETAEVTEVNLLNVIRSVISFLGYQLEQENILIRLQVKANEYFVKGNHNELEQVVTNIFLNARDAIRQIKKNGFIDVSLSKTDDWIEIAIRDDGIGIKDEIMSKIFDPFFTTKDVGKGTGLGLCICQAIVEKHNGLITVQSEPSKGSTFTIKLPKVIVNPARRKAPLF